VSTGPDVTGSLAAQAAAVTNDDQVATHPTYTGGGNLDAVLAGPEVHYGAVQEPDEAAEDAALADPGDVAQMGTGLPDADDYGPQGQA
jgi:hypothetical protein